MNRATNSIVLAATLALSACATLSPQEKSAYAEAQAQVQQLESEPLANQAAGRPLQQAREALSYADSAVRHHDAEDVMFWSYLATRRAEVGEAMVAELHMRNQIADATAQRDRLRLQFQRHRAELAETQAQQAREQAQSAEQQLQQAQQQAQAQQQQQQLAMVRREAQQQVQEAEQRAQQAEQQAQQQLEALQARQTAEGMVLTLSGSPMFATGSDTLEPGAVESLQGVAHLMQEHPMMQIRVEGFTDNRGSDAYNDQLSQRRAQAVANALESDGIDPSRLVAIGRGKSLPVASNATAAGRQQNRRVELLFSDTQGRFASVLAGKQLR